MRYFEENAEDSKPSKIICRNCGEEGNHIAIDCPVQIVRAGLAAVTFFSYAPAALDLRRTR